MLQIVANKKMSVFGEEMVLALKNDEISHNMLRNESFLRVGKRCWGKNKVLALKITAIE